MDILFLLALFILMLANMVHSQSSTEFGFSSFDPKPTDLIYQGDTHVPCDSQKLRLTKTDSWSRAQTMSLGRVVYSKPIHLWQRFVTPKKEASFIARVFLTEWVSSGDGFAFFMAPVGTTIPCGYCSNGGNLGIYNSSSTTISPLFAVEIDFFANPEWDPSYPHMGINVNSRISRTETRLLSRGRFLYIFYNATDRTIQVQFGSASLRYNIDLSTILPDYVQVGVSSATGADTSTLGVVEIDSWDLLARFEPIGQEMMMNIHPQYDHLTPE